MFKKRSLNGWLFKKKNVTEINNNKKLFFSDLRTVQVEKNDDEPNL